MQSGVSGKKKGKIWVNRAGKILLTTMHTSVTNIDCPEISGFISCQITASLLAKMLEIKIDSEWTNDQNKSIHAMATKLPIGCLCMCC